MYQYDARAILKRVSVLKQQRLRTGTAAHAASAGKWAQAYSVAPVPPGGSVGV